MFLVQKAITQKELLYILRERKREKEQDEEEKEQSDGQHNIALMCMFALQITNNK